MPSIPDRPVLVVLGAGDCDHRAFVLQQIAAIHPVIILDADPPAWAWPYVVGTWAIDLADDDAVAAAVAELARSRGVAGVMTYLEHHVVLAARVAEDLGLPSAGSQAMRACRDKALSRRLLDEHHVPSARSFLVENEQSAVDYAKRLGYPVVVKPRAMAGSAGVVRADHADHVRRAFEAASEETVLGLDTYAEPGVLVEEYLPGPEISVECVVLAPGDVRIVAVTRKRLGAEPRFLETGHCVSAHDELLNDPAVADVARRALAALDVALGVVHVEMRLAGTRGPCVVEVNGRLGGDLIPLLTQLATGVSLAGAAAELALGRAPALTATRQHAAAVQFAYPPTAGTLVRQQVKAHPVSWLERFAWTSHVGQVVEAPPISISARLAHWVVTGPTQRICEMRLLLMKDLVKAEIAPFPAHTATTACVR